MILSRRLTRCAAGTLHGASVSEKRDLSQIVHELHQFITDYCLLWNIER